MELKARRSAAMAAIAFVSTAQRLGTLNKSDTTYMRSLISTEDIENAYRKAIAKVNSDGRKSRTPN